MAGQTLRDVACLGVTSGAPFDSWAPAPPAPYLEDLDLLAAVTLESDPGVPHLGPPLLR